MTNNQPSLFVALADHGAIVKVNGRANVTSSVAFKRLISELRERGVNRFVLDLSDCVTMDSTFLGVLAGTALKLSETTHPLSPKTDASPPSPSRLHLLNPNQRVSDLLDNLGVADLFCTVRCDVPPAPAEYQSAPEEIHPSRLEVVRTCLQAHQLLMDLNPENISKFKDVTQFLAEDLKKLNAEAGDTPPEPAPEPSLSDHQS